MSLWTQGRYHLQGYFYSPNSPVPKVLRVLDTDYKTQWLECSLPKATSLGPSQQAAPRCVSQSVKVHRDWLSKPSCCGRLLGCLCHTVSFNPDSKWLNEKEPVKFEDSKSLLLFLRRGTHRVVQLEKTRVSFRHATCNAWEPNDAVFLVLITGLFSTPSPATSLAFHPRILIHSLPIASNLLRRSSCLFSHSHSSVK